MYKIPYTNVLILTGFIETEYIELVYNDVVHNAITLIRSIELIYEDRTDNVITVIESNADYYYRAEKESYLWNKC